MSQPITQGELADLIMEAGHHHHQAYISSDGVDPEWPLWYASHIQTRLWDSLGSIPTRSEVVWLLLETDRAMKDTPDADWMAEAAKRIVAHYAG